MNSIFLEVSRPCRGRRPRNYSRTGTSHTAVSLHDVACDDQMDVLFLDGEKNLLRLVHTTESTPDAQTIKTFHLADLVAMDNLRKIEALVFL